MAVLYLTLFYLILWSPWSDVSSDDYLDPEDNSEEDEDSDFIEHYDNEADVKSKGDFRTRIRRFDAKNSTVRALDAEEVDVIRDVLKQLLAGREINLPVTSISHAHDRSTKDHEFTGLTKFYEDIIEEIIDNANRQGLLPINNASKSDTLMFSENCDTRKFTEVSEHRYTGIRRMVPAGSGHTIKEPTRSFERVFLNRHETSLLSYGTTWITETPTVETYPDLTLETNTDLFLPPTLPPFIVYQSSDISNEMHVRRHGDTTITTPGSTLTTSFIEGTKMNPSTTIYYTSYKQYQRDGSSERTRGIYGGGLAPPEEFPSLDYEKDGGGKPNKHRTKSDKYRTKPVPNIIETTTQTNCTSCPTCRKKPPRKKTRSSTTTTTLPTTTMPTHFDVSALVELVANFSSLYEKDIVEMFNETLQKYSIPTCSVPTTTTTEAPVFELTNATIVAKCFVCGMETPGVPRRAYCADAFAGDFLPLVPVDPKARGQIANYRKYCRYLDVNGFLQHHTEPRSVFGRFTGGCSVRWIDVSGIYTQRACRNRRRAMRGRHFGSKRMAKLEMALRDVDNGCVISPMASLVPLSRGISLYARFHACVCTGSWCNVTSTNRLWTPYTAVFTICLIVLSICDCIREKIS